MTYLVAKPTKKRPYAYLSWPGKVAAFKECETCNGKGRVEAYQPYDAQGFRNGFVRLCSCGNGVRVVYLTRGRSIPPLCRPRPKKRIFKWL